MLSYSDAVVRVLGGRTVEQAMDLTLSVKETQRLPGRRQAAGGRRRLRDEAPWERLWPHGKASPLHRNMHARTEPPGRHET